MNIPLTGKLFRGIHSQIIFFVVFGLILGAVSSVSAEVPEPSPSETTTSDQPKSIVVDGTDTVFVFEEPSGSGNGKASSIDLPDSDACLFEPPEKEMLPRIAIIIDDMGHHQQVGEELLDLDLNLTYSFLPHAPFTKEQEVRVWEMGRDVLVHMPMEPRDSTWNPGPGALYLGEPAENITLAVEENLALVPHAIGVNNHMGSRFTADRLAMHEVLLVLQAKNLFFVDSLTAPGSVGEDEARKMGIRTASRHVFLDNSQTQKDICRQLKRLVALAKKHGSGIGIGHPNRATIDALNLCREMLLNQVRIVGVHELVN